MRYAVGIGSVVLGIALALAADAARAQPFEVDLSFGPGVEPCFTSEQLVAATQERLVQRAPRASTSTSTSTSTSMSACACAAAPLAIQLQVATAATGDGWRASIVSEGPGVERGVREIALERGCSGVLSAMSLVLALIVEQAANEAGTQLQVPGAQPTPAPAPPSQPPAPRPPAPASTRDHRFPPAPWAFGLAMGPLYGLLPEPLVLTTVSARIPLPGGSPDTLPVFLELGGEWAFPRAVPRSDVSIFVREYGSLVQLGGRFASEPLSFEPCAGAWLRVVRAEGFRATEGVVDPKTFVLAGWHIGWNVHMRITRRWSVFAVTQLTVPFAPNPQRLVVRESRRSTAATSEVTDSNPFGNSSDIIGTSVTVIGSPSAPLQPGDSISVNRTADLGVAARIGVALLL